MIDYYDLVLVLIPVSLIGIAGTLSILGYPSEVGTLSGAFVAAGLMGHAMFIKSPVPTSQPGGYSSEQAGEEVKAG